MGQPPHYEQSHAGHPPHYEQSYPSHLTSILNFYPVQHGDQPVRPCKKLAIRTSPLLNDLPYYF